MIEDFKNKHKGGACVIIGNGPSLAGVNLDGIKFPTFGANKIYEFPFTPTYYTCVDSVMVLECIPWLYEHPEFTPLARFLPNYIPYPGAKPLNVKVGTPFSEDPAAFITLGGTVTFVQMQLALYMGFKTAYLIGVDNRYPKSSKGGVPGSKFIATGEDPDHFGKDYFKAGRVYNRPELEALENSTYPAAGYAFAHKGCEIINLGPDSALKCYKTGTIDVIFDT